MKLWQVIQWGNIDEGSNGKDAQCVVSAVDMMSAIAGAFIAFEQYNLGAIDWKGGTPDVVYLLGQDDAPDGDPEMIIPIWLAPAYNLVGNPSWHRDYDSGRWLTSEEMYGEEQV